MPPVELGPARITQSRDTLFLRCMSRIGLAERNFPTARVSKTATGLDTDAVDKKTLYLDYIQGSSTGAYLHFEAGETLTVTSTDSGRNGNTFVVDNGVDTVDPTRNYFGKGIDFVIEDGHQTACVP